ncbi:MAG TPA: hypothetical protein VGO89_11790 [Streptomyces sp.]|jgi:hypothetical protein|nr:hypothetical protein [Streptomyces sp.]
MSESVKSTVKDFEEDIQSTEADTDRTGDRSATDGHSPISPKKKAGNDDLTTTDGHSPIAAP